ncbi:MAG: hypothetical protein ABFE13_06395 [Phycisphaerales bacterium]
MRSVPNPGTPRKSRLACCAAGGGVFLLRVSFSPTGWCMTVLAQWLPSGGLMLCVFHTGTTRAGELSSNVTISGVTGCREMG